MKNGIGMKNDENGDTRVGNLLVVFGIFMVTIVVIISSTNAVSTGVGVGKIPPNILAESHSYGDPSNVWNEFNLYSYFDQNWSGNHTEGQFIVMEFLDTDCPYCWDDASTMSNLESDVNTFNLSERVELFIVATQLPIPTHETSREEIVAFQEKTSFAGCRGGNYNCMDRIGSAHTFKYIDDINSTIVNEWDLPGTPYYVIIKPNGIIAWDSMSAKQGETPGSALANILCKDGGPTEVCGV